MDLLSIELLQRMQLVMILNLELEEGRLDCGGTNGAKHFQISILHLQRLLPKEIQ
jgi:hypothetical protein